MTDLTPESEALVRMRGAFLYSSSPRDTEAWLRNQLAAIEAAAAARAEADADRLAAALERLSQLVALEHDPGPAMRVAMRALAAHDERRTK